MPPHCDSMDGPVVSAARRALEAGDADLVLPFVPKDGEDEVRRVFETVIAAREAPAAREVADLHFFETVVRVHRAGEGAPYTGLKPAGLDHGPVIPVAERAVESGSPDELIELLASAVEEEVRQRLGRVTELRKGADGNLEATRAYVEAMLDFEVWSHRLHQAIRGSAHEHGSTR